MGTAVFNCNFNCNDDCEFCFNKIYLNKTPSMNLEQVIDQYMQIPRDTTAIIISGGEPSLHPDFWRLMVFFYYKIRPNIRPALNTNGILFSNPKYLAKLVKLVGNSPLPRKQISLSFSNISDPSKPKNQKESMKIQGISNILGSDFGNTRIFLSVIITRDNYEKLPEIGEFITSSIHPNMFPRVHIDIRYPFSDPDFQRRAGFGSLDEYLQMAPHFSEAKENVERFILHLFQNKLSVSLKNIPICNLNTECQKLDFTEYKGEKRLRTGAQQRMDESFIRDFFSGDRLVKKSHPECQKCSKKGACSVEIEYLDAKKFTPFQAIL